ncbi:hypothetical protein Aam_089_034 [Acidocella aminolytica 101 = DSM 11237]|uniref:Uncharacterized protein n=1 Tax=Acidocella aminolytica 101 = DSM 11237 TaxID=1120923 RepID=A0A0D6PIN9_9PROT|nr:hypothetical protein Aam_089_034 [Acidocella aminolytica 101 = DSM 11237]
MRNLARIGYALQAGVTEFSLDPLMLGITCVGDVMHVVPELMVALLVIADRMFQPVGCAVGGMMGGGSVSGNGENNG